MDPLHRPTTPEITEDLDIPGDLASAMRKSWSDALQAAGHDSPSDSPQVSTPIPTQNTSGTASTSLLSSPEKDGAHPDHYQLLKHHYAISDDAPPRSNSIIDAEGLLGMLQELEFGEEVARIPTARKGSIEDVHRIRQLLNPRSSFSGASSSELGLDHPGMAASAVSSSSSSAAEERKGWVTTLDQDDIRPILVLAHSLSLCHSRYRLHVLYSDTFARAAAQLASYHIETVRVDEVLPTVVEQTATAAQQPRPDGSPSWSRLRVFSLFARFDLVCFLSPTLLVLTNMDELLESPVLTEEVDNETCVLLSNSTASPDVILLRPHSEIAACIQEFLTVYLINGVLETNEKWRRLTRCSDVDILSELFQDAWSLVDSGYCYSAGSLADERVPEGAKALQLGALRPWATNSESACGKIWFSFWNDLAEHMNP